MSVALRMLRVASLGGALFAAASAVSAGSAPSPWTERQGTYLLPAQNGEQLAVVALVNPATHRVAYGFRDLPQRMRCAPASVGRDTVYDVEGTRIAFSKECIRGVFTYIPRNVPAKRAFAAALAGTRTLHVRTASFFPMTFDLTTLPLVREDLELAAASRRRGG